jgi:hypothetical protein
VASLAACVLGLVWCAADAGAQKLQIKTEQDPAANFKAIRTYAWLPPAPLVQNVAPDAVRDPTLSQEALGPSIVAAVDRELAARGLVRIEDADTADVHVVYFAALVTGVDQTYLGQYYGYVTGWGSPIPGALAPTTSMTAHERGTVIVDIVQREARRGIWHGSVVTRVQHERTTEKRIERINEATARMFQKFPIPRKQ